MRSARSWRCCSPCGSSTSCCCSAWRSTPRWSVPASSRPACPPRLGCSCPRRTWPGWRSALRSRRLWRSAATSCERSTRAADRIRRGAERTFRTDDDGRSPGEVGGRRRAWGPQRRAAR
ncbi:exported hypothetical protein [Micrococcus luteus]|nr:exported hypothetical protein [Micrococcus luteus]